MNAQSYDCNNAFIQVKIMFNFITFSLILSSFTLMFNLIFIRVAFSIFVFAIIRCRPGNRVESLSLLLQMSKSDAWFEKD